MQSQLSQKNRESAGKLSADAPISIVDAPFSFGQKHDGVEDQPMYLRELGLIETLSAKKRVFDHLYRPVKSFRKPKSKPEALKLASECCESLSQSVYEIAKSGHRCLILGGDHSISIGSIDGILRHYKDVYVIWIDAHGDINTPETSETGNLHGMPVARLLGLFTGDYQNRFSWQKERLQSHHLTMIGQRALDPGEVDTVQALQIPTFSSKEVRDSPDSVLERALSKIPKEAAVHVSFDVDVIDPEFAPATGVPEPDGISLETAKRVVRGISQNRNMVSMDLVEFNPSLGKTIHEVQLTAKAAIEVAAAAFE